MVRHAQHQDPRNNNHGSVFPPARSDLPLPSTHSDTLHNPLPVPTVPLHPDRHRRRPDSIHDHFSGRTGAREHTCYKLPTRHVRLWRRRRAHASASVLRAYDPGGRIVLAVGCTRHLRQDFRRALHQHPDHPRMYQYQQRRRGRQRKSPARTPQFRLRCSDRQEAGEGMARRAWKFTL